MNKHFCGEASDQKQVTYVQNKETVQLLNDSAAVLEHVQSRFQEHKDSLGSAKTGSFRPNDESACGKMVSYSSIDPFLLETATGKPEHRKVALLEHVRDACISQEKMRHLKNWRAPGRRRPR